MKNALLSVSTLYRVRGPSVTTFTYKPLIVIGMQVYFIHICILHLQTSKSTTDPGAIQKAADFVRAFMLGFDVEVHYACTCMRHCIIAIVNLVPGPYS